LELERRQCRHSNQQHGDDEPFVADEFHFVTPGRFSGLLKYLTQLGTEISLRLKWLE
jgi:hypothetical protein